MNLYIWGDSGTVGYGADTLVVMAPDLRTAKRAARKAADWSYGRNHGTVDRGELGEPDLVIKNKTYAAYFMVRE